MVKTKVLGFIAAFVGVITLAGWSFEPVSKQIYEVIPEEIGASYLLIGGVILIVIGLIFIKLGGNKRTERLAEVPIYQGNQIIGYRRHGK